MDPLDELADRLYTAPPAEFVAVRNDAVRAARDRGDRDLARAAARLRRPTRAAWLANLLARHSREQLDGLLSLAGNLADAQRTLDGDALRALSSRRRQLVSAMAREAGRLAREAHEPVTDSLLRELGDILEAALADPVVADEVRSGRLTRTVSYSGFGPQADPITAAAARERAAAAPPPAPGSHPESEAHPGPDPAEAARRQELADDLADAQDAERRVRAARDDADAEHEASVEAHDTARDRVAELTAELETAQQQERAAVARGRDTAAAARTAARDVGTATTRTARARARLEKLD